MEGIKVNYVLATQAGYKVDIANSGYNPYDRNEIKNKAMFKDAVITRPASQTDLSLLDTHALITVNGYVHPTTFEIGHCYIKNANTALRYTGFNHVGIVSFFNVKSGIKKHPINEMMISTDGEYPLFEKMIISFDKPMDGVLLIMAGYVIPQHERYFKRISDRVFVLYPEQLGIVDKIYELHRYRDIFKELGLETAPHDPMTVDYRELISNRTMRRLLTLFNSFLVEIPDKVIECNYRQLEATTVPNNFRTEIKPTSMMLGGYGKGIEYNLKQFSQFKYNLLTVDAIYNNLVIDYKPIYAIKHVNNNRVPTDTYRLSQVCLLEMEVFDL